VKLVQLWPTLGQDERVNILEAAIQESNRRR